MTSNLLLQLDDLELALHRYCFLELGVGDATRLKRAFLAFKERLVAKMYAEEDFAFRQSITRAVVNRIPARKEDSQFPDMVNEQGVRHAAEKKGQILLAEHDTRVAAFFIKNLHKAGYEVFWSSHLAMVKSLIRDEQADVIICGMYSSRSFGREVLNFTRNRGIPRIPVLLIGGAEHCEALRDAIHLGADDYLAQHITAAEIIGKVKQLLKE